MSGAPEERTLVDVDLRAPGSTARDEEVHGDQALIGQPERYYYELDLRCAFATFGPMNEVMWQAETEGIDANPPEAWAGAANDAGIVEVELLIETEPARLTLTANGHTERYVPSPRATGTCP